MTLELFGKPKKIKHFLPLKEKNLYPSCKI